MIRMSSAVFALIASAGLAGCAYPYETGAYYDDYGYGSAYYGWYDGYYYPGWGYYIYDDGGHRHKWNDHHRRHWDGRRGGRNGHENWGGYDRGDRDWRGRDGDRDGDRDGRGEWGRGDRDGRGEWNRGDRDGDGRGEWGRGDGDGDGRGGWNRGDGDREGRENRADRGDGDRDGRDRDGRGGNRGGPGVAATPGGPPPGTTGRPDPRTHEAWRDARRTDRTPDRTNQGGTRQVRTEPSQPTTASRPAPSQPAPSQPATVSRPAPSQTVSRSSPDPGANRPPPANRGEAMRRARDD